MAETTGISWCDRTWSPWIGCTKISPACDGCYAAHLMDTRLGRVEWGAHGERKRTGESYWRQLAKWDREAKAAGRTISVFPSLCDPWDNAADPGIRREWFAAMRETPHLLHLLLSKRPQNAVAMAKAAGGLPGNAALGTTVEDRARLRNIDHLRAVPAAVRFLSIEPLLEDLGKIDLTGIHLAIVGGESGPGARPMQAEWVRSIRDQCAAAGVAFFMKQMSGTVKARMPQIPADILIREMPASPAHPVTGEGQSLTATALPNEGEAR